MDGPMYLKKVEVCGFKSFPEKLEVEFDTGMTAIVGPNGCGKTNLADAIRWVLGEQSARQLRGRTMEDVIFNGSEGRKPLGMAEVSLTIAGASGILPIPYDEVCVTRRVFRSAESEYFLNRKPCRLKDIKDLFLDTGVGSNTYSLIEREMIEEVLEERSGARRNFIEEAAGISKYKDREESARRKLHLTDQDLVRLEDVIRELEKRVRSLQYQMGKARRYRRLTERLRTLESTRAVQEVRSLRERASDIAKAMADLRTRREACQGAMAGVEADLEKLGLARLEHQKALAEAQENLNDAEKETEALEGESLVLRERLNGTRALLSRAGEEKAALEERFNRIQAERENASVERVAVEGRRRGAVAERRTLEAEVAELEKQLGEWRDLLGEKRNHALRVFESRVRRSNELGGLAKNLERLFEERKAILQQVSDLATRMEEMEQDLTSLDEETRRLDRDVRRLESRQVRLEEGHKKHGDRLAKISSRSVSLTSKLDSLEEKLGFLRRLEENLEGYEAGVRTVLSEKREQVQGIVADLVVSRRPEYRAAVETAISSSLQCLVTPDLETAQALVEFLREEQGGVAGFLALDTLEGTNGDGIPRDLDAEPGVVGRAVDHVTCEEEMRPVARFLLGGTVFTDSLDTALRLSREPRYRGVSFVSMEGESVSMPGRLVGGRRPQGDPGVVGRRSEIDRTEEQTREVRALLDEIRQFEGKALRVRERLSEISQVLSMALDDRRENLAECQRRRALHEAELTQCDRSREMLGTQLGRLEAEIRQIEQDRSQMTGDVGCLTGEEDEASTAAAAMERRVQSLEETYREKTARLSALGAAIEALEEDEARLAQRASALEQETERVRSQIQQRTREMAEAESQIGRCEAALGRMADEVKSVSSKVAEKRAVRDRLRAGGVEFQGTESALRSALRQRRDELEQLSERIHQMEMEAAGLGASERSIRDQIREKYEVELDSVGVAPGEEEVTAGAVEEVRQGLRGIGPVNLVALEEYEEEKQRLDFLSAQREDLVSAKDSLEKAIVQIHRTARKRFREALEEIRQKFVETFATLFEEGEADLRLDDPDDPLRSGVSIVARPKGKLERHVTMLSGGERSLTAIAFLVALYLVKPSAFCILDEVDAALDDVNVLKFAALLKRLKERTQFVMITHNKRTMEVCDCLYGVTMSEAGVSRIVSVDLRNRAA